VEAVVVVLVVLVLAALLYALAVGGFGTLLATKAKKDEAAGAPDQRTRPDRTNP
jgi:hypothetical protein